MDPEFGSGCVKITPAHDFNDYEIGLRHDLAMINVLTVDASIELPDTPYHGLDRYAARERIVADLEARDLVEKIDDHKLMVPRGDRSHAVVEPYLTDQWYVKIAPLAEPAIKAVADGRIRFVPENWSKTYFEWMNNIQDWCISRQIWWGHRIPAWYDEAGNVYVADDEAAVRAKYKLGEDITLRQDDDVLDTWFSSALWPFSTLGWPQATPELKTFYPTSVLVTGFDIIFFWVARMIMMGLKFMDDVPFDEVYIHGLVRDAHGNKMSKSKGNILDPLDLIDGIELEPLIKKRTTGLMQPQMAPAIEKATRKEFPDGIPAYGTDALRFTFASLATQGRDIRFDLGRIEGYRNFCNKLWNASRYVYMNAADEDCGAEGGEIDRTLAERWIDSRLQQVTAEISESIDAYRFDLAAQTVYQFVWDEYCSWYIELSKVVLYDETSSAELLRGTRQTLVRALETVLRLLHPIMPFITEELWRKVAPLAGVAGDSIIQQPYPLADDSLIDADAIAEMEWVMAVIAGVRNIRGEMNIAPSKPLPVLLQDAADRDIAYLEHNLAYLTQLARLADVTVLETGAAAPESATALVGNMKVLVPLGGLIDVAAERERLDRELDKTGKELERSQKKLANANFVDRAPAEVVEKEHARVAELETALTNLTAQRQRLKQLQPDA